MSFFGKLKTSVLHSGPPAPPRRTGTFMESDNSSGCVWPEGDFDDEDCDMYEAPPCERPTIKVQPRQVEENVYLERSPNPIIPKRQVAPPPRPAKINSMGKSMKQVDPHNPEERYIDPNDGKPPEVIRNDKPKKPAPKRPPIRPLPVPQVTDEDVYLDPNEGQDDVDDTYLEPVTETRNGNCMLKKIYPNDTETNMASTKHPNNLPEQPPRVKLPVPRPKPNPFPTGETERPVVGKSVSQGAGLQDKKWFAGVCDRKTAEETVLRNNKDGTFLIRFSNSQNNRQQYTLVVFYSHSVYNIPVRFLEDSQQYALGKEGKKSEELFSSLPEMISHHMKNPILLIDRKSQAKHSTHLSHPVRP